MVAPKLTDNTLELFATDLHFPTEDPAVFDLLLQVARALKPRVMWLNGDVMDFTALSRFLVHPSERVRTDLGLGLARERLQQLRKACPNACIIVKEGNHDLRLQKYLWSKAPELTDLEELELPKLMHLKQLKMQWVANHDKSRIGELWHLHGNEIATGYSYPAKAMLAKANNNVIFGHVHKFSVAYQNQLSGGVHVAWSIGCVQRLNVEYDLHPAWQQGFALVEYTRSGLFHVNPVEVFSVDGRKCAMVYGKLYKSAKS